MKDENIIKLIEQTYERIIESIRKEYQVQIEAKDREISLYKDRVNFLEKLVLKLSEREMNYNNMIEVKTITQNEQMSEVNQPKYDQSGANIGGIVDTAQTGSQQQITQYNYGSEQKPNLAEAAAEIQKLLEQLCQTNPTSSNKEKMIVVAEAVDQIENNPTLKARIMNALKAGGVEEFKEAIDHPLVNILIAIIEGWREAETTNNEE